MAKVLFGARAFDAGLVIFDKDGTLIDFAGLWAKYTVDAVEALMKMIQENANDANDIGNDRKPPSNLSIETLRTDLYAILGYDPVTNTFDPQSPVVTAPLPTLYTLAAGVLYRHGWGWLDAELLVQRAMIPVINAPLAREMIRATAPLSTLFGTLRKAGVQIAIVTSDDRRPTVTALEWLEVADKVAFIACADDGYPYKPAPEAIWAACEATGISITATVMVGDSTTDMLMAQRAGAGLRVAVLTGTMDAALLAPLANVVLASVGDIQLPA